MENTTQTPASKPPGGGWKVMGILSVVFGGLSILFSFIPCLGAYAMYTGILSAVIAIVALVMANSAKASKMMAIVGLVISLASVGIGYWRYTQIKSALGDVTKGLDQLGDSLKKYGNQMADTMKKTTMPADTTKK